MANNSVAKKVKVCQVSISLGRGGAERFAALLSTMLHELGYEVTTVILTNEMSYSYSGRLLNLGEDKEESDTLFSRLSRFNKLRKFIKKEEFDVIIDHRPKNQWARELFYLDYIYKNQKLIYVVHNYMLDNYMTDNEWMAKRMVKKIRGFVGVSNEISKELSRRYPEIKIRTIYNPSQELAIEKPEEWEWGSDYILFLGRLNSPAKNLPLLIEAYKLSGLYEKKIPLLLIGAGNSEPLKEQITSLGLENYVSIISFTEHVGYYLKQAKFLVLSSRNEGFPMVLIESLSVGTPVVSVDCMSGPKEVIQHKRNGLLVPNYDPLALANAMKRMYADEELYRQCKEYAKESIAHLEINAIAKEWVELIEEVKSK